MEEKMEFMEKHYMNIEDITEETRQFIQNEICNILNQETRITDYSIYTEYITDGILIKLTLKIDDEEINTEFILNDDGVIN